MSLIILLAQCVCMFIASFAVGSLPLMFKSAAQDTRLKAVSTLGMGLLVGAALTIIIPEGVSTVYEALPENDDEHHNDSTTHAIGLALLAGFALMLLYVPSKVSLLAEKHRLISRIESLMPHPPETPPSPPSTPSPLDRSPSGSMDSTDRTRPYPVHVNSSTPIVTKKRMHIEDGPRGGAAGSAASAVHGLNATLGLVIHGAADGIALGASSLSGRGSLSLVIFLAVLVHKGPTALGLTTTLMSLNLSPPMIRRRLLIFSFAAPLGAVITFFLVKAFGWGGQQHSSGEIDSLGWWTGIALLFSGGSFLYVATVIQPLSNDPPAQGHSHSHGPGEEHEHPGELGKYQRTGLLIVGMLGPVLLSWIVGDAH